MPKRRYTLVVAEQTSGLERKVRVSLGPVLVALGAVVTLPVLIGLGAAWKAKSDVAGLYENQRALELENASFRQATAALSGQIESLQSAVSDLGARSTIEPGLAKAMANLPSLVKAKAMGSGATARGPKVGSSYAATLAALTSPDDTFGLLRTLLEGLESRLSLVRQSVDRRDALAAATPSIWPAHGWLSSPMGYRTDPVNGQSGDFHPGLDIARDRGQPVYATAAGLVTFAGGHGNYGNLLVIDHGYGLETRYGHLMAFLAGKGDQVKRGDVIGRVGNTGRATGNHLHYEVLANGTLLNPLRLLTNQKPRDQ
ncbi:MAG TPA: M23 family metallopeptidase [Vicinamibacterales bacterium]|nr:M23 family metallopeptidase [Vicinamibacterales bacterium]